MLANQANREMASTSTQKPHLLTLAGEIRNQIIRLAIVSDSPIAVVASCAYSRGKDDVRAVSPGSPSLARTCKQLREEVNAIYFEENVFTFLKSAHNVRALQTFERMAGLSASKTSCVNIVPRRSGDVSLKLVRDVTSSLSFLKEYDRSGVELSSEQLCIGFPLCCGSSTVNMDRSRPALLSTLEVYFSVLLKDTDVLNVIKRSCHDCGGVYWDDFNTAVSSLISSGHFKTRGHRERL